MGSLTVILALMLALVVGLVAGWFLGRAGQGSSAALHRENAQLRADLSGAQQARQLLSERVADLQEREQRSADVLQVLAPVKEQLTTMEKSVRAMEIQRAEQFGSVSEALKASAQSQEQLRSVTSTLSTALKSSSARGTWGEAQLKRVVEAAGMTNHVVYSEQVSSSSANSADQDRAVRPDMVINLPGRKTIVLDAKAPLNAYLTAQDAEDDTAQKAELARHARAVKAHVDTLAKKKYWAGFDASPELVLCFIPVESALSAALDADPTLLDYAASKNVALVSPVSLLSALKAISFSWRQDALTDNARELFVLSKQLYERLGTAGAHLSSMGRMLGRTVDSYNSLVGSLETRVFVTARKIADLDSAQLVDDLSPQPLESAPKPLTSPEFLERSEEPEQNDDAAADTAQTAFAAYQQAFEQGDLPEAEDEEDHLLDPEKSAYEPTFEDVPLWDQYPEGFSDDIDDGYDGPAIITEHDYPSEHTAKGRSTNGEQPFDYDSWNS